MENLKENKSQENRTDSHLMASSEPHQQGNLDQATNASAGSFTLEPEKGIEGDSGSATNTGHLHGDLESLNEQSDQTDGSSEEREENSGIGFGETGAPATSPALAGDENTDEDAADPDIASSDTSKGFDSDQQAIDAGLDDGDLDNDVPSGSS